MSKNIIITGGAGFIGSHLCKRLLDEGNHVICVDNFFTGRKENIEELLENPNFKLIEHDIVEPLEIDEKIDEIYNLACPASPPHYQFDPVKTWKTSVIGILNMLELARKNDAKILQASTSEVYGDPLQHPQNEKYWGNVNTVGIRSCYDEGKRAAETLMVDYRRQYGVQTKLIRIFNTYGPNMDPQDGRVVSNFIIQALRGEDITVYGEGEQTRSFCFVSDLVEGMTRLMNKEGFYGPVNIGNDGEYTILQFAEMIIDLTNSKSKIVHKPLPSDDPTKRRPDLTLARKELGYEPKIHILDGLKETIKYFKGRI